MGKVLCEVHYVRLIDFDVQMFVTDNGRRRYRLINVRMIFIDSFISCTRPSSGSRRVCGTVDESPVHCHIETKQPLTLRPTGKQSDSHVFGLSENPETQKEHANSKPKESQAWI